MFTIFLFFTQIHAQTIMSWNIENLGETKYRRDTILPHIYNIIKESGADIIAIQEVTLSKYGDSCIIYLSEKLNYNYIISNRTTGSSPERYAFLWSKKIKLNWSRLDGDIEQHINREPYIASFKIKNRDIVIRQVHLSPSNKNPMSEFLLLRNMRSDILCGDFNIKCNRLVTANNGYYIPLCGKPTTLKIDGTTTKNDYDHFLVAIPFRIKQSYVFEYKVEFNRNVISDHLPIVIRL